MGKTRILYNNLTNQLFTEFKTSGAIKKASSGNTEQAKTLSLYTMRDTNRLTSMENLTIFLSLI